MDGRAPDPAPFTVDAGARPRVFCCHKALTGKNGPPNSLDAVAACVAAGAPRIEIDIQFLADDRIAVFHDELLDGETEHQGQLAALTARELAAVRLRDGGSIARLEQVVDAVAGTGTRLQLDLKTLVPLTAGQRAVLSSCVRRLGEGVLLGSRAHWTLRAFEGAGIPLAFDPTLLLSHWGAQEAPGGVYPARTGIYGFWDDHPLAHIPGVGERAYLEARFEDLVALAPAVEEWMVNVATILAMGRCGYVLGAELAAAGKNLAAWTLEDAGALQTGALLRELADLGVSTFITDRPLDLAGYLKAPA